MTIRIAMWSGPRNISTAMMRSWENRSDTVVIDEPFYAHYLRETGSDHPGRTEILAAHDADAARVADHLVSSLPDAASIFYQKHMAHHMLPGMDRQWMRSVTNCFLIRDPAEMIASLHVRTPFPTLADTGLPQQVELFQEVRDRDNAAPPVLDSRDVLGDPAGMLRKFCDQVGVEFDACMLSWPAGPRDSDGAWAPWWYDSVRNSTGFQPARAERVELPADLSALHEQCLDLYETLYRHRLVA